MRIYFLIFKNVYIVDLIIFNYYFSSTEPNPCVDVAALAAADEVNSVRSTATATGFVGLGSIKGTTLSILVNGFSQSTNSGCDRNQHNAIHCNSISSSSNSTGSNNSSKSSSPIDSLIETRKPKRPNLLQLPCVARQRKPSNGHISNIIMATEDLLQPGHVVKERWKVVRFSYSKNP